jgi:lipoyl(octanoyl) transferase
VPCGISEHGITSLVDLGLPVGLPVGLPDLDAALRAGFPGVFGATEWVEAAAAERRSA